MKFLLLLRVNRWGNVMILLLCSEGDRWGIVMIMLMCDVVEQMGVDDDTACVN